MSQKCQFVYNCRDGGPELRNITDFVIDSFNAMPYTRFLNC